MSLFPYQAEGAEFLTGHNRALLADGMGLGKSAQAIVAAGKVGARTVVVICPAIARINWRREWDMWGGDETVFIESYDTIVRRASTRDHIKKLSPDLIILDEAHYLKNRTSKRTKCLYGTYCKGDGLVSLAPRVWLLTGTPTPNDVSEIYTHISALWPDMLPGDGKYFTFLQRYCSFDSTPFGIKILGNKRETLPELRSNLNSVMLRRRAEDVLKDLPPIVWQDMTVEPDQINSELAALEASPEVMSIKAVLGDINAELVDADNIAMATLRKLTGIAKAHVIGKLVSEELEANAYDKVIIFAHHRDVIAELLEELAEYGAVSITGSTSQTTRQHHIDEFQNNPAVRVFIGQIQACATAITLHAANQVIFAEASWTPSDNAQAAKRAHRIGQTRPVMVRMIGLAGSIDEAVTRVLARKSRLISEALGD